MKYTIRLANENDLAALCNVRNNKNLFKRYLKQSERKEVYLVIAEQGANILGFAILKVNGHLLPKLSDLYIKENYRRNGIGSGLIKYRENIAKNLGYSEIFVSVDPIENPKMIKLIKRHGYEEITEPYIKKAVFFNNEGTPYDKTYTRIDLKKLLT